MVVMLDTFDHPPHKMTTEVDGSRASRGSPRQGRVPITIPFNATEKRPSLPDIVCRCHSLGGLIFRSGKEYAINTTLF